MSGKVRIGAHVPVAKGLSSAVDYAVETGCETAQIFAKSPQQWLGPPKDPCDAEAFVRARMSAGIEPLFTHSAYLINVGSLDAVLRERSIVALADELERASLLGADGVVLHMGTCAFDDLRRSAAYAAASIGEGWSRACERCEPPPVTLENSAGAGRSFGVTIEELCAVAEALAPEVHTNLCLDTCHAFAAGMDVATVEGWADICDRLAELCGLERLVVVHANDCMFGRGEHRDRHAWVGDGQIGVQGFRAMLREPRLAHAAAIVEMPGDPPSKDVENVGRLKEWRDAVGALER